MERSEREVLKEALNRIGAAYSITAALPGDREHNDIAYSINIDDTTGGEAEARFAFDDDGNLIGVMVFS